MRLFRSKRSQDDDDDHLPIALNALIVGLGVFILCAMSVVIAVFEEFTAFTDYTQDWIEFNFFIHYWDKLAISRVYLAFIFIYGAVVLAIGSMQIHGYRKKNFNLLHFTPILLVICAVVSMLGALCWLIITAVNHNEGFLATGGFIFERMRFKGNVWKDLKYREQSFRVVTAKQVPVKSPILYTWVHQRERDFSCCGWDSYLDYARGGWLELPESCCNRKFRSFRCGADYLNNTGILNTRGCGPVMHSWYRTGFTVNIIMATIGIIISAYQFFLYSYNRKQYYKRLYELDEYKRPIIQKRKALSTSRGDVTYTEVAQVAPGPSTGIRKPIVKPVQNDPLYSEVKRVQAPNRTRPPVPMREFTRLNQNYNDDDGYDYDENNETVPLPAIQNYAPTISSPYETERFARLPYTSSQ